jgi:hypothetical protein
MPAATELNLIKRAAEFCTLDEVGAVPRNTRGIYALLRRFRQKGSSEHYRVVYIGMASGNRTGVKGRLYKHKKKKVGEWTHFSVFEVHDNITDTQVQELEGILRHIFRRDPTANRLGVQRGYKKLKRVTSAIDDWKGTVQAHDRRLPPREFP